MYGHSRKGVCGVCQGIAMGSWTPETVVKVKPTREVKKCEVTRGEVSANEASTDEVKLGEVTTGGKQTVR